MKTEITMNNVVDDQPLLWQDRVLLDEDFFRALREHPVPVSESALRAIGPRSMVIDVYIWLAYRLHALKRDIEVGWPALFAQFGAGFGTIRRFRQHFLECLALAMAAYPEALVATRNREGVAARRVHTAPTADCGISVHPSPPPSRASTPQAECPEALCR